jgi:hypothetical protein
MQLWTGLDGERVLVDEMGGEPASLLRVPGLPLTLALDDQVWICSTGPDDEVHDVVVDGIPAHPERVLDHIAPIIEEVYRSATVA